MNFIKSARFIWLGFTIGSLFQLPILIGMKAWPGVIAQSVILAIAAPLALIGFFKK